MHGNRGGIARRNFLQAMAAGWGGFAGAAARPANAITADNAFDLSAKHREAVNRRRRIVVQYDSQATYGIDFEDWLDYRFHYIDQPGSQIDSVFWDMGRLGQVLYPSKFLDPLVNDKFQKWRDQGIYVAGRLIAQTKRRGLEVFWHHRASEVDLNATGTGAAWKDEAAPLKRAHPDWVLKAGWWRHGLWNFAVPAVREHTVRTLREVAEMYDIDGLQIDFARHVPCLPLGRQWELRDHVTELVRSVVPRPIGTSSSNLVSTTIIRPTDTAIRRSRSCEACFPTAGGRGPTASGGSGVYRVNPRQRLLRLDFEVDPRRCRIGENLVNIRFPVWPRRTALTRSRWRSWRYRSGMVDRNVAEKA